jgi:hypothetical protein
VKGEEGENEAHREIEGAEENERQREGDRGVKR